MTKTACVFPGQGSQSVGMLKELAESSPVIEETFKEASDALGYDLGSSFKTMLRVRLMKRISRNLHYLRQVWPFGALFVKTVLK